MSYKHIAYIIGAVVVAAGIGYGGYTYVQSLSAVPKDMGYVIEPIRAGTYTGEVPSLAYQVAYSDSVPQDARVLIDKHIADDIAAIKKYPYDGNSWMDLALWYHTANDFAACEKVWKFLIDTTPNNYTVTMNLGRLYHFDLHQYVQAEEYFREAMVINPDREDAYIELFELYRYSYKQNTSAAVEVMQEAIKRFPDNIGFQVALGEYYRDTGRPVQARTQLMKAQTAARKVGNLQMMTAITEALSRIP